MDESIIKNMNNKRKTQISNLMFGDLLLVKSQGNSHYNLKGIGPHIFLKYSNSNRN